MFVILGIIFSISLIKWTIACLIGVFALYKYYASKCNYWESQGVHTASVGLLKRFKEHWFVWERELVEKNGKIFGIYELTTPVLYLSDPELLRDVLVKDFHIFNNRRDFMITGVDPVIDNFVFFIKDDQWKKIRTVMSPTFTTGNLKKMRPLIQECLNTMTNNLENISKSGKTFDMKKLYGAYSMEVIIQVAFGTKVDALIDENNPILLNARKLLQNDINLKLFLVFVAPKLAKLLKISPFDTNATKFFKEFALKLIDERHKLNNESYKRTDFLQIMLDSMKSKNTIEDEEYENDFEDRDKEKYSQIKINEIIDKTLTEDELVSQCVIFFMAGYEGIASTMSQTIYNLANHPEVQEKLYRETKTYLDKNSEVDYEVLRSMKYLDAVVSETLRIFPGGLFLERVPNQDYIFNNTNIKIKKGQILHIPTYAIMRDPEHFPDPDSFKPERFLSENITHHPYTYLPFGAGPRNCIGMRLAQIEVKLAVIHSVNRFKFIADSKPLEFYKGMGNLSPKSVPIRVERRL